LIAASNLSGKWARKTFRSATTAMRKRRLRMHTVSGQAPENALDMTALDDTWKYVIDSRLAVATM
jgi:hypothetical protein